MLVGILGVEFIFKFIYLINMKKYTLDGSEFNGISIVELQNNPELWEEVIQYRMICRSFTSCKSKLDFMDLEKWYNITIYLACSFYDRTCPSECDIDQLRDYIEDEFGLDIDSSFDRALYKSLEKNVGGEWKRQGPSKLTDISVDEDELVQPDVTKSYFTFNLPASDPTV